MKIHIIGGPGSGKSFLAEELSRKYAMPHYDLDDLFWDNCSGAYGVKRDATERDALLEAILAEDDRITEGVYRSWCLRLFDEADKIYVLSVPRRTYRFRIIRRFIKRKLGLEKGKRETLKSLSALLKWADKYERENMPEIMKLTEAYPDKVVTYDGLCAQRHGS